MSHIINSIFSEKSICLIIANDEQSRRYEMQRSKFTFEWSSMLGDYCFVEAI